MRLYVNRVPKLLWFQSVMSLMWSETVGLRTRPVSDQKIGLGLVSSSLSLSLTNWVLFTSLVSVTD